MTNSWLLHRLLPMVVVFAASSACHWPLPTEPSPLPVPSVPARTAASPGQYSVGLHIEPGRYFAAPSLSDCHYRLDGIGRPVTTYVGRFVPRQWIVDISESDKIFKTSSDCGTWTKDLPTHGAQGEIRPGMWLVGSQIAPGTYSTRAVGECTFNRLRDFRSLAGESVIEFGYAFNEEVSVTILAGDTGFSTMSECGTWTREGDSVSTVR